MNRVIKFRVWDNQHSLFWNVPHFWRGDAGKTQPEMWDLEQFTGLFDRNGKEIYEGDIVEYVEGVELGDKTLHRAVVVYDPVMGSYGYAPALDKDCWNYPWEGVVSKVTVIGNVHENPDLLKDDVIS